MILTNYYSRPPGSKKPSALGMIGSGLAAFGIGYASSLSKEEKAANRARLKSMLGFKPEIAAQQKPAPIAGAVPKDVVPTSQEAEQVAEASPTEPASDASAPLSYEDGWGRDMGSDSVAGDAPVDLVMLDDKEPSFSSGAE